MHILAELSGLKGLKKIRGKTGREIGNELAGIDWDIHIGWNTLYTCKKLSNKKETKHLQNKDE